MIKREQLGVRVLLAIPTTREARRSMAWIDGMLGLQMPLGSSLARTWIEDADIAEARNLLCQQAIEMNCQYLFFLSDDVIPPNNTLLRMLDRIGKDYYIDGKEERASLITGVYWTKNYPPEPYLFNGLLQGTYRDWKAGEFFPVDMAGCDCLMIETEMLRHIPQPWFSTEWSWEKGQPPGVINTEDFYFYMKARKYGYRLWADTGIQCLHEDRPTGALFGLTMEMPQAYSSIPRTDEATLIADVGSGIAVAPMAYGANTRVIRFDIRADTNPDVRCDLRAIPEQHFGKYDVVYASHVLEHFRREEAPFVLKHWTRLLKPGGKLELHTPNFEYAMKIIFSDDLDITPKQKHYAWSQIYGDQAKPGQAWEHKNGFTKHRLEALLSTIPFLKDIEVTEQTYEDKEDHQNLKAVAILESVPEAESIGEWWDEYAAVRNSNG